MNSRPVLRQLRSGDLPLIYNSWLRSFKKQNDVDQNGLPGWMYWRYYHEKIEETLARAETRVLCAEAEPDIIFGWICFEHAPTFTVVHYLYVKNAFRKIGLARRLVGGAGLDVARVVYTYSCRTARELTAAKCEVAEFIPIDRWLST